MTPESRKREEFVELATELERCFTDAASWPTGRFETLALRVFERQFRCNDTYRRFCASRGVAPASVASWEEVPAVPATAFKHLDLSSVEGVPEAVFRTSGTTLGREARGVHPVPRLSLYRAALLGPFERRVLAGLPEGYTAASLIPRWQAGGDSSLGYMVTTGLAESGAEAHWLVDQLGALDVGRLREISAEAARDGRPVLILGTALSFVHLLDRLDAPLPSLAPGSRLMETGGFKGVGREVRPERLRAELAAATGLPSHRIVNEYGMTELLSQLYEPVLEESVGGIGAHVPPPWLRVRALDPLSLDVLPEGEVGVLAFFDLANAGSISAVLTQDLGSVVEGRVRLRGRTRGAEPRGCSRAMDELLSSADVTR